MSTLNLALAFFLLVCLSACASQQAHPGTEIRPSTLLERSVTVDGVDHKFAIWVPANYDPKTPLPCVVFLHGSGECGTDGLKQTTVGILPAAKADPAQWPCVIVMPQKPVQAAEWEEHEALVLATLAAAQAELNIDRKRISLTGLSQGGHGTWFIGARHRELFSALAPCCGYGHPNTVASRVAGKPIWAFHGEKDDVVPPEESKRMIADIAARKQPPEPRLTLFPDANHNCWDKAYGSSGLGTWLTGQVSK